RAGTALPAPRFTPLTLTHHLAVADLAEALLRHYPGARWITERELRRDTLRHPPRPTSHHSTGHLEGSGHVPDGVLIWHDHHVAVELELTPKGPESYARILRWYAAALAYRRVVWFCADPALLRRLSAILERERVADFIAVKPLPAGLTLTTWG
ncbi:MAG TPA: hypothetical protein VHS99_25695, partial [Chloroflexota bacterium]|nr:hypothetical protein [Chloroflexota bacterium]